MEIPKFQSL